MTLSERYVDLAKANDMGSQFSISLWATYFIYAYSNIFFLLSVYLSNIGLSLRVSGWVLASFYVGTTFIRPFGGWVLERFGLRKTLLVAGIISLFGALGVFFSLPSVPCMIFYRAIGGVGYGIYLVGLTTHQSFILSESVRGSRFGWITVLTILPLATLSPLGGWFLRKGFVELYFFISPVAALCCIVLGLLLKMPSEGVDAPKIEWGSWKELLCLKGVHLLVVSTLLFALANAFFLSVSGFFSEKGLNPAVFLWANALVCLVFRGLGGRIFDRWDRRRMAAPATILMAIVILVAIEADSDLELLILGSLFGLGLGFGFPVHLALISDLTPPRLRPKGTALGWFFMDAGWFISPLLVGYLASLVGEEWALRLLALAILVCSAGVFLLWERFVRFVPEFNADVSRKGA